MRKSTGKAATAVAWRWRAMGASVAGARHVEVGEPCQDAHALVAEEELAILSVADGHGDKRHTRSDVGARIAVDVTRSLLAQLARDLDADPEPVLPLQLQEAIAWHLPRRLAWEWNREVRRHAGHADPDGEWHADVALYGSTVLGALFTPTLAVFLQIGDGDLLLANEDGHVGRVFGPEDDDLWGTQTWSLCQAGSASRVRLRCHDLRYAVPRLALLSTDGLRDSLQGEPDGLERMGRWFLGRLDQGQWDSLAAELPALLGEISRRGNGDDATVALVYWEPRSRRDGVL